MGQITIKNDRPVYITDGGELLELKHTKNDARKIKYIGKVDKIKPNMYYVFKPLQRGDKLYIEFEKGEDETILWEYEGEFQVHEDKVEVCFPQQIRWVKPVPEIEEGYLYVFHIKNLVGRMDKLEL